MDSPPIYPLTSDKVEEIVQAFLQQDTPETTIVGKAGSALSCPVANALNAATGTFWSVGSLNARQRLTENRVEFTAKLHRFVCHIDSIVSDEVDITLAQARECWELAQQDVRKENNNG